jgi:hypothetical protein
MELEVFFTIIQQTYSKLVISFMNRKSSCGYATHFFILNFVVLIWNDFISLIFCEEKGPHLIIQNFTKNNFYLKLFGSFQIVMPIGIQLID